MPSTADVRDPDAVERVGAAPIERFGKLHVAVNNAGVVNGGYSWEIPLEDWHRVIDIDLWGVIHGIRSFVPRILASGEEGHVVNTASMAAVLALGRLGPYTVAKHGVLGLSDVLRAELASLDAPIGVSVVMPGMIKTGMNPVGTVSSGHRGRQRGRRHPPRGAATSSPTTTAPRDVEERLTGHPRRAGRRHRLSPSVHEKLLQTPCSDLGARGTVRHHGRCDRSPSALLVTGLALPCRPR